MKFNALLLGLCLLVFPASSHAGILSYHSFNDMFSLANSTTSWTKENVVGEPTLTMVENGGALVDANGASGIDFTDADGDLNVAGQSATWASTDVGENYWELDLATTGYEDLMLRFDNRSSSLGALFMVISWAIDNSGIFTEVETLDLNRDSAFTAYSVDMSDVTMIENASSAQIRGTWSNDGTDLNTRLENLQLTGSLIPEPGSLALLGLGCGLLMVRTRMA